MSHLIRDLAHALFRFVVVWVVDIASILLTAAIFPGINFVGATPMLVVATSAAFLLGIVNFLIRPLILLLALPFGFIAIFILGFFLNAIALIVTGMIVPGFQVQGLGDAFLGSIVLAIINTIFTSIISLDDDNSFYSSITERLATREKFFEDDFTTQGLVLMEIDGLSYHHVKKAIAEGWMPTLKRMMDENGYVLSRFDCGLPSQTSACQAGIMFGNNYDIPAFRWFDKDLNKLIVSGKDAALINSRYAQGKGLMRAGSSVNNMMNGDARVSILTLADLFGASPEQSRRRAQDIYLIMLNPYFFLRTLVLYFGDVIREVLEGLLQQIRREAPRLNRLAHFYPFIRAATTVLMRDVSGSLTILDIVRGTPALYVTWPGYDEVAHHSGPWTRDAFRTLRQYDKVIARVRDTIERKAPRPYELIVLSDHGQSYGWTFKQRYGKSLNDFIEEHLPQGMEASEATGSDDGMVSVSAMALELDNMQQQGTGGRFGRRIVRGANRAMDRSMRAQSGVRATPMQSTAATTQPSNDPTTTVPPTVGTLGILDVFANTTSTTHVTVCGSGNLAQVYFNQLPGQVRLDQLNATYPGVIDALVQHEGIGVVVAYSAQGEPIAFGKTGAHNLITDAVTGTDPLLPYGDPAFRAKQLARIAAFPHNGDLTIISTLYPDGTVAAMEELVGNHGGFGGEQTDAFLFHPADFTVPDTTNSADVFTILDARRQLTIEKQSAPTKPREVDAWSLTILWQGLIRVRKWAPLVLRSIFLDRSAFRQIAGSMFMTAPAILIALLTSLLVSLLHAGSFGVTEWLTQFSSWAIAVLVLYAAARALRGTGTFTATLRAVGFAQSAYVIAIFGLIDPLSGIAQLSALALVFLATWIGVNEAHRLSGWRTFLLPVAAIVVRVVGLTVLSLLLSGTEFTFLNLFRLLGLAR